MPRGRRGRKTANNRRQPYPAAREKDGDLDLPDEPDLGSDKDMGPKKPVCSCTAHSEVENMEKYRGQKCLVFNLFSGKKVQKRIIEYLVADRKLSSRAKYLCSFCVDYFDSQTFQERKKRKTDSDNVCGCKHHEEVCIRSEFNDIENSLTPLSNYKNIRKELVEVLQSENRLYDNASHLCYFCAQYFKNGVPPVLRVCELLKCKHVSNDDLAQLSFSIGQYISNDDTSDVSPINLQCLKDLKYSDHMASFSTVLTELVNGISCRNKDNNLDIKKVIVLEQLLGLAKPAYIGSYHHCLSLIFHYLTGSKNIVNLLHKFSPSKHYTTLMKDIDNNNSICEIPTDRDGVIFFDNNQILSRRWNVVYDAKCMVSVVTSLLFLQPPIDYEIQKNPNLTPYLWLNERPEELTGKNNDLENAFKILRNNYIESVLNEVKNEQSCENSGYYDDIDKLKNNAEYLDNTSTRDDCFISISFDEKGDIVKEKMNDDKDPYNGIESGVKGKPDVTLLDPLFTNPCSYESVAEVFTHISNTCMPEREWMAVGCDGLPYLLGSRVIENYLMCPVCGLILKRKELFISHCLNIHNIASPDLSSNKVFKNILLIPGLGHYEINFVKALFKMLWKVGLKELAKMLGFRSAKALSFCESASNHHKSWAMLQIFLTAVARELVLPYVRDSLKKGVQATLAGYFSFISGIKSPTYIFLFKVVFNLLYALDLFRKGVLRNNHDIISMTMQELSILFYGLNMTSYMEIDVRRRIIEEKCPEAVKDLIHDMSCMSHSGHPSKGEGGDFILESYNRKTKMWMPHGAANERRWLRVYRNLPDMEKIKDKFTDDEEDYFRKRENSNEVAHWRREIRSCPHLFADNTFNSMDGTELEAELVDFEEKCQKNKESYCQAFPDPFKCERIFFTNEERRQYFDIANQTKDIICKKIQELLNLILEDGGDLEHAWLKEIWDKEIKRSSKSDYLQFYKDCLQAYEEIQKKEDE